MIEFLATMLKSNIGIIDAGLFLGLSSPVAKVFGLSTVLHGRVTVEYRDFIFSM